MEFLAQIYNIITRHMFTLHTKLCLVSGFVKACYWKKIFRKNMWQSWHNSGCTVGGWQASKCTDRSGGRTESV